VRAAICEAGGGRSQWFNNKLMGPE
jgi:hypothetical protein